MSHSISLSRSAALCGGFFPLELLARKLACFGEAEAGQALLLTNPAPLCFPVPGAENSYETGSQPRKPWRFLCPLRIYR